MDVSVIPTNRLRAPANYWVCQLAGWGFYVVAEVTGATQVLRLSLGRSMLELGVVAVAGIALTHLMRAFLLRRGWPRVRLRTIVLPVLGLALLFALPMAAMTSTLSVAQLWGPDQVDIDSLHIAAGMTQWARRLILVLNLTGLFLVWTATYLTITGLRHQRTAALRQSELTRALQASELRLLKAQLNPHFLFNSLNSVRALIADDPAGAQKAVTQLARTLRYTLTAGREELVTLARELEIVEDYLSLESLRFGERLRIERNIAPETLAVRVPVMLLQTVVENAIKHGIAELPAGGELRITASLSDGVLHIAVENTRPETTGSVFRSEGVGLDNARERLRLLFGPTASLELDLSNTQVAIARITIPGTA